MKATRAAFIKVELEDHESFIATDQHTPEWSIQARAVFIEVNEHGTHVNVTGLRLRPGSAMIGSSIGVVNIDFDDLPENVRNYVLHALLDAQEGSY